jgi:hypothetical protein
MSAVAVQCIRRRLAEFSSVSHQNASEMMRGVKIHKPPPRSNRWYHTEVVRFPYNTYEFSTTASLPWARGSPVQAYPPLPRPSQEFGVTSCACLMLLLYSMMVPLATEVKVVQELKPLHCNITHSKAGQRVSKSKTAVLPGASIIHR